MADETYKISAQEQILNNKLLSVQMKDDLLEIVKNWSNARFKAMLKSNGNNRYFYDEGQTAIVDAIYDELTAGEISYLQGIANKHARQVQAYEWGGGDPPERLNEFIAEKFTVTTYTRGGHKYVRGYKIY